jgi:hypothetical protein
MTLKGGDVKIQTDAGGQQEEFCPLCGEPGATKLTIGSLLFPSESYAPEFHRFDNFMCPGCGVVFSAPRPHPEALVAYYNGAYRSHGRGLVLDGVTIEPPLQAERLDTSLARFANFHRALAQANVSPPGAEDTVVDFGAYQGLFLHAAKTLWGCRGIAIDYNQQGIAFAKSFLGLTDSRVTTDLMQEVFPEKVRFASLVHALEHLPDPRSFLAYLHDHVVREDGWLYLELPNLLGSPINDPTHFFTYNESSLRWLVEASGFEVQALFTTGHPRTQDFLCANDEENLVCLARWRPTSPPPPLPRPNVAKVVGEIRRHWSRHARAGAVRQGRLAVTELARALYYALFAFVLEPVLPGFARWLRRRLRRCWRARLL